MSPSEKNLTVQAASAISFEDALQRALAKAQASFGRVEYLYIKEQSCSVQNNSIAEYRITAQINEKPMSQESQQPATNTPNPHKATAAANEVVGNTTHNDESYIEAPEGVLSDYSDVEVEQREQPTEHKPGSATSPENGGGYSG